MTSLPRGLNSIMIEFTITQVLLTNILCSIAGSYLRKNRVGQISSLFSPPTAAADTLNSFDLCYQLHYLTFSFIVWIWKNISHQSVPIKCMVCHENRLAYDCPCIVHCDRASNNISNIRNSCDAFIKICEKEWALKVKYSVFFPVSGSSPLMY